MRVRTLNGDRSQHRSIATGPLWLVAWFVLLAFVGAGKALAASPGNDASAHGIVIVANAVAPLHVMPCTVALSESVPAWMENLAPATCPDGSIDGLCHQRSVRLDDARRVAADTAGSPGVTSPPATGSHARAPPHAS